MTPDEFLKATTPNALEPVSDSILDDLRNHGGSLLLTSDAGVARQIQASIGSIEAEKLRRRISAEAEETRRQSKPPRWIEWLILVVTALGILAGVLGSRGCFGTH